MLRKVLDLISRCTVVFFLIYIQVYIAGTLLSTVSSGTLVLCVTQIAIAMLFTIFGVPSLTAWVVLLCNVVGLPFVQVLIVVIAIAKMLLYMLSRVPAQLCALNTAVQCAATVTNLVILHILF